MTGEPAAGSVGAVVLSGGRSRRLGIDKADTRWRGHELLDHVLRALPSERGHTLLVTRPGQVTPVAAARFDEVVTDDPGDPAGPLRGVVRGLRACPTTWAWVIACDMPLVRPELLRLLLSRAVAGDLAVVPEWAGRLQPLCALYACEAAAGLASRLAAGERRLCDAVAGIGPRAVPEADLREVDPRGLSFFNVNTPHDLADLESVARGPSETERP